MCFPPPSQKSTVREKERIRLIFVLCCAGKEDRVVNGKGAYEYKECYNLGQSQIKVTDVSSVYALSNAGMPSFPSSFLLPQLLGRLGYSILMTPLRARLPCKIDTFAYFCAGKAFIFSKSSECFFLFSLLINA